MKTECGKNLRDLSRWVDGELKGKEGRNLAAHVETCAYCAKETALFRSLNQMLQSSYEDIQVSRGFETVFWKKVSDRQRAPWFMSLLGDLETLLPALNARRAVAFALLAFFIGNMGGVVSTVGLGAFASVSPASIRHLSGLQEFKGIPSNSLAAAYLKTYETEISE